MPEQKTITRQKMCEKMGVSRVMLDTAITMLDSRPEKNPPDEQFSWDAAMAIRDFIFHQPYTPRVKA